MKPMIAIIILGIIVWILNFCLGIIQIKNFNKHYVELRKLGKVAIGRKRGYFQIGTVVMILINDEGKVIDSRRMQGMSVFARFKKFIGLEGMQLGAINKDNLIKYNKYMKLAILDAVKNYNTFKGGEN